MASKGIGITSYEPRGSMKDAVDLAVPSTGALHGDRGNPTRVLYDSLTVCTFNRRAFEIHFGSVEAMAAALLEAAYGWDVTPDEVAEIKRRDFLLERCFSLREGDYVPVEDDDLPRRFFEEPIEDKYGETHQLDRNEFLSDRRQRYEQWGLTDEGIPSRATLSEVGLDFAIPAIEQNGFYA